MVCTFLDTNECEEFPEYCNTGNRMCRNTEGSYACVCRDGFKSVPRTEECIREFMTIN